MAFAESDRVNIRTYLGFSALFAQADPRLEQAITHSQSVADGGDRPDNTTELAIKGVITKLQSVDTQRENLIPIMFAQKSDEVNVDPVRADAALRSLGRTYVHRLARFLDTLPRADIYSAAGSVNSYPASPFGGRSAY